MRASGHLLFVKIMSVLFPKVNKPREWDYRPIYYDPKKDEMEQKLRELQNRRAAEQAEKGEKIDHDEQTPYMHTLRRGSFRAAHDESVSSYRRRAEKTTRITTLLAALLLIVVLVMVLNILGYMKF